MGKMLGRTGFITGGCEILNFKLERNEMKIKYTFLEAHFP
jgi:hypothetical protein